MPPGVLMALSFATLQAKINPQGLETTYEVWVGALPCVEEFRGPEACEEDKIAGTPKEAFTHGHGWRMAVVLNDRLISSPVLRAALRDGATISGRFSNREINQLAADLKAGSLSFTPAILSEENVSPELGYEERTQEEAEDLFTAVSDPIHGVLACIKRFW